MKRVEIDLKEDERAILKAMCSSGVAPVRVLQRAQILLSLDQGILDQQIAAVLQVERTRIWRVRQRYLEHQLDGALYDQPRSGRPIEYGDQAEAELVALACSDPPTGYSQWSLPLLTAVARRQSQLLQSVSQETVRQKLKKKRCKPWLKQMWCIGKLTPQYRQRMYNIVDLYQQPYNPNEPVVCVDEKSKQL
jgi:Homeodomain-like domain